MPDVGMSHLFFSFLYLRSSTKMLEGNRHFLCFQTQSRPPQINYRLPNFSMINVAFIGEFHATTVIIL